MRHQDNPYDCLFNDGYMNLLVAIIKLSLRDLYRKNARNRGDIEKYRRDAAFFFDSPHSIFNKIGLDKEYIIKHYEQTINSGRNPNRR